jgi:hypothetical protein
MASCTAAITDSYDDAQLICWDGVSLNILPRQTSNCNPPNLCLLSFWDYSCESLHLANRWVLREHKLSAQSNMAPKLVTLTNFWGANDTNLQNEKTPSYHSPGFSTFLFCPPPCTDDLPGEQRL